MGKILLIDWNRVVKSDKLVRFPVSIDLARELFGNSAGEWKNKSFQEKYEDRLNTIFKNMIKSGIEFFAPGGSEFRRLLTMLWWFYIKKSNFPERNSKYFTESYEQYEESYKLDPELFEYLYDEYYQYFRENYIFEVNNDVQRLIDRKPDNWELGVFSEDLTKNELGIILDELKSTGSYGDIFNLRFGYSSPVYMYSDVSDTKDILFPNESVAKAINQFNGKDSNISLLYESPVPSEHISSDIQHSLLSKGDLIDRFNFDNTSVLLEADSSYQAEEKPKEEVGSEQLEEDNPDARWCNLQKANISHSSWTIGQDPSYWHNYRITHDIPESETLLSYAYPDDVVERYRKWQKENEKNSIFSSAPEKRVYEKIPPLTDVILEKFPLVKKAQGVVKKNAEFVIFWYIVFLLLASVILKSIGIVDKYENAIFILGLPLLSIAVIFVLTGFLLFITFLVTDTMNFYYEKRNSGMSAVDSLYSIIKTWIKWILILGISFYIATILF